MIITFESIDGAGKSTQISKVHNYLKSVHLDSVVSQEPTNTNHLGRFLKSFMMDKAYSEIISDKTNLMLFILNRSYHIDCFIKKHIDSKIILLDRYVDSSMIYQGLMLGLAVDFVKSLNDFITGDKYTPDLTFLLDVDPKVSLERLGGRQSLDIMDNKSFEYYTKARSGFLDLAKNNSHRFRIIDANLDVDSVFNQIKNELDICLNI